MRVQEGNILDVYLWGGRRGERLREGKGSVLVSNHHLSDETARTRTYTHFGTLTPDQLSNPRKGQAGLDWYGGRNTTDLPRPLDITTTYTK